MATEESAAFIRDHSKLSTRSDGDGTMRMVTSSHYHDFMKTTHSITPEILAAVNEGERDLVAGAIHVSADDLAVRIDTAKAAGEDPSELRSDVRISRGGAGQLVVETMAAQAMMNPRTRVSTIRHGVVRVRAQVRTMIGDEDRDYAESIIGKHIV